MCNGSGLSRRRFIGAVAAAVAAPRQLWGKGGNTNPAIFAPSGYIPQAVAFKIDQSVSIAALVGDDSEGLLLSMSLRVDESGSMLVFDPTGNYDPYVYPYAGGGGSILTWADNASSQVFPSIIGDGLRHHYLLAARTNGTNSTPIGFVSAISSANGQHALLSTGDTANCGTWVSADGGATWNNYVNVMACPAGSFWFAASADGQVVIAAPTGLFPSSPVYASADGGATWATNLDSGASYWFGLAVSPDGSVLMAADANNLAIKRSTDGGATWADILGEGRGPLAAWGGGGALVAGGGGLYTSTWISGDYGATWLPGGVLPSGASGPGVASAASDGSRLYVPLASGSVARSTDGGATWQELAGAVLGTGGSGWLRCSADGMRIVGSAHDGTTLRASADGGDSWADLPQAGPPQMGCGMSADGLTLFATPGSGLIKSTDGGQSWNGVYAVVGTNVLVGYLDGQLLGIDRMISAVSPMAGLSVTVGDDTYGEGVIGAGADVWVKRVPAATFTETGEVPAELLGKFVDGSGHQVDLGAAGLGPGLGAPDIFYHAGPGDAASFGTNRGTGGDATVNGGPLELASW